MESLFFNGNEALAEVLKNLKINIVEIVAATSLWATPKYCNQLRREQGNTVLYPNVRKSTNNYKEIMDSEPIPLRRRREKVSEIFDNNNTFPEKAIKSAIARNENNFANYTAYHIYPQLCYDKKYYTNIENLVLIPSVIISIIDDYVEVGEALKYRAYQLYGFCLDENNPPQKPANYPANWSEPICWYEILDKQLAERKNNENVTRELFEMEKVEEKISFWSRHSIQFSDSILGNFMRLSEGENVVSKEKLRQISDMSEKEFEENFIPMTRFADADSYKIFEVHHDEVRLWKPIEKFVIGKYNHQKMLENEY